MHERWGDGRFEGFGRYAHGFLPYDGLGHGVYDKRTVKTADLSGRRAAKKRQTSWLDG